MTKADDVWYRLELLTRRSEEVVSDLWSAGALGVEVQDRDTFMDDGSIAPVPDGVARVIAFFDEPFDAREISVAAEVVSNARYDDVSWQTAWMKFFRPIQVSERAIVGPPWEEFSAPPGGVKVVIEPGMAFGTGTHETTGLCGELLDEHLRAKPDATVVDVGCGTGVLSMIAVGLGAKEVIGTDIDPTAVAIATENLARNGMSGAEFSTADLSELGTYDIVIANILAHILLSLQDALADRVAPGGRLLLSGITTAQIDDFLAAFQPTSLRLVERRDRGEWVALVFEA